MHVSMCGFALFCQHSGMELLIQHMTAAEQIAFNPSLFIDHVGGYCQTLGLDMSGLLVKI